MRAIVATGHGGPDVLEMQDDHPEPSIGPHDLVIEVHACALNPVDAKIREGALGERRSPFVLGFDVSGVVVGVGASVRRFAVGDEVFASPSLVRDGANAELVCVDERVVARKPTSVDHVRAAALPLVSLTAWEALYDRVEIGTDDIALIHAGGGGVGHIAIQLAKLRFARVITTASRPETQQLCRDLGADEVIDHRNDDFVEAALDLSGGRGCSVVFDTVGGDVFERSLECVGVNGRMVTIVANESAGISQALFRKNATLVYEFMGVAGIHGVGMEHQSEILGRVRELVDAGVLRPHVGREIDLAEVPSAHAGLLAGTAIGKTVARVR